MGATRGSVTVSALTAIAAIAAIAATVAVTPVTASAQRSTVRHDTIVTVHKDTVVHVKQDTAVVTTTVTTNEHPHAGDASIGVTLARMPNYKTMTALLNLAHLMPSLRSAAPMTLFAPTDDAFAKLSPSDLAAVKADTARLRHLLLNMMVSGKIDTGQLLKLKTATNMLGTHLRFGYKDGTPLVNDQPIVQPGVMASNGFIHGVSGVLGMSGEKY